MTQEKDLQVPKAEKTGEKAAQSQPSPNPHACGSASSRLRVTWDLSFKAAAEARICPTYREPWDTPQLAPWGRNR